MPVGWNHNTHYHRSLLQLLPSTGGRALDVGCGDGGFAARLAERYTEVTALDADDEQVAEAALRCSQRHNVSVQQGDFLSAGLPADHFDVVTALASFHHMPFGAATEEVTRVLKRGGRLVILGIWTDSDSARDRVLNVASTALDLALRVRRGPPAMTSPTSWERTSWAEAKADAAQHLPAAQLQRHLLWRYTLVWDKPGE